MTTTKSYLAGLGMTGIVIGSVLVLLAVGTGLVAFEGAHDVVGGRAPLERVVVGKDAHSVGGGRAHKRPDAPPAPATAARPPVAPSPVRVESAPRATRGHEAPGGRESRRHGRHGHGGTQARTRDSLGGGAAARDASADGGGVAANGPPGLSKRKAHTAPGRSRGRSPSTVPGPSKSRAPSTVRGLLHERAAGHGQGLAIGHRKTRAGKADGGAAPVQLP